MNERLRRVLHLVIDNYLETGNPTGSKALSSHLSLRLSSASIRSIMGQLEDMGLLYSPHVSAGRLPTVAGLRLFVEGLMEVGDLSPEDRKIIESRCQTTGRSVRQVLEETTQVISGLSKGVGLVFAPKTNTYLRHIEFVPLSTEQALVVLVDESGLVENGLIKVPRGMMAFHLIEAGNFLARRILGKSLGEVQADIQKEVAQNKAQIDGITQKVVNQGLATWGEVSQDDGVLIVRGQSTLLQGSQSLGDFDEIQALFRTLETRESMLRLLREAQKGDGVQVFLGAQSSLFNLSGCSVMISSYKNDDKKIVGAVGVIGPKRMNYARIIPMLDYTSQVVGKLLNQGKIDAR